MIKNKKGITLIALIITIIVMLILAGVTLNSIIGDNGIIGKAKKAVGITNESAIKEEVEMAITENMVGYYTDGLSEGKTFFEYMSEKLTGYETPSGAIIGCEEDGSITYTDKKGNIVLLQMDENGLVEIIGKVTAGGEIQDTIAPKVTVRSTTTNSITFIATDGVGVVAYAVTESEENPNESDWLAIESSKKYTTTVTGKAPNKTYYLWAKDASGNVSTAIKVATVMAYSVTYNANGGVGVPTDTTLYAKDTEVTVKFDTASTRTGYSFLGWTDDASNKGVAKYTSSGTKTFKIGEANVTLYAVWEFNNKTLAGDTSGYSYKNPVIPQGFKAVDVGDAKWEYSDNQTVRGWNKGLVIQDTQNGNQFVWVPCTMGSSSDVVKYERWCTEGTPYSSCSTDTSAIPSGITETTQISKYGGFYVARFEAGNENAVNSSSYTDLNSPNNTGSVAPVSIEGSKVWNFISYNNAVAASKLMVNNATTYGNNKSGLITGTQWDTIMKWYKESGIGVENNATINSKGISVPAQNWGTVNNLAYSGNGYYFTYDTRLSNPVSAWENGSFSDTEMDYNFFYFHASGLNTNGIKKNIADLAGNMWEFSAEVSEDKVAFRGGQSYFPAGTGSISDRSVSWRQLAFDKDTNDNSLSFRTVLYVQ